MKPTECSQEIAVRLLERFGSQEAIPPEILSACFMIHMRLQEAEQEIEQLMQRVSAYQAGPPASAGIAGDETGEF
jgi:hypothetical protein